MKVRNVLTGAALVFVTAAITSQVVSQDKKAAPAAPPMSPEAQATMAEMMQKCTAAGTPGENQKLLNPHVGKWNGAVTMWMMPDAPPMDSTCTSEAKWIMDGRYIAETVEGSFGGETFMGQAWTGYDNVGKKFVSVWIDNMGTGLFTSQGTYDAASKSFKYGTSMSCPMTEKTVAGRMVEKWTDNDHYVTEMYGPWYKTGKEYKSMEIHYTRIK